MKSHGDQARAHDISEDEVMHAVFLAMSSVNRLATVAGQPNGDASSIDGDWAAR